jgi:hypothetical protein
MISGSFYQKNLTKRHLTKKSVGRTPFDRKFMSPKGHLTNFFKEKGRMIETTFEKKVI